MTPTPSKPYNSLMTQDNSFAFASFSVIGGLDCEGEFFGSMRIFGDYETALDYARELINRRFDYAYVAGVNADGSLEKHDVTRVADCEPSVVSIDY